MDEPTFKNYSLLPPELQYKILKDNDEVRNARSLSIALRDLSLYDKIEKDLILSPTSGDITTYLKTFPLAFKVFYQFRGDDELFGNLVNYEYIPTGYNATRYIICEFRDDEIKRQSLPDEYNTTIEELAKYANPKLASWDILIPDCVPVGPVEANVVYYDLLTYWAVIIDRLKSLGVSNIIDFARKAVMTYLDEIINSHPNSLIFVYYFVVSSAHLLGIVVTEETKEYFEDSIFEYDSRDYENSHILRMEASIQRIYPLIVHRLGCLQI